MTHKLRMDGYKPYVKLLSKDQKKVLKANPDIANKIVNQSLNKNRTFRCVVCDKLILSYPSSLNIKTCSPKCYYLSKATFLGKKRPEHSAKMKVIIKNMVDKGDLWTEEHRRNNKEHMKRLNSSIDRKEQSEKLKSVKSFRTRLKRFLTAGNGEDIKATDAFKKSRLYKLAAEDIDGLVSKTIKSLIVEYNSLRSLLAIENNPNMGANQFYKRIKISKLKFNKTRKSVIVRSSLEYDFIKWLEKKNIPWIYEWVRIKYTKHGNMYIPDFKIYLGKEVWVVECKGFYSENNFKSFKKEIVGAAWCRKKGYRYTVLSAKQIGKLGSKIDLKLWKDLTAITDKALVKFLRNNIPGAKNLC